MQLSTDEYRRTYEYIQTTMGEAVLAACTMQIQELRQILAGNLESHKYLKEILQMVESAWKNEGRGHMKDHLNAIDIQQINETEAELLAAATAQVLTVYANRGRGKQLFGQEQ